MLKNNWIFIPILYDYLYLKEHYKKRESDDEVNIKSESEGETIVLLWQKITVWSKTFLSQCQATAHNKVPK